MSETSSYTWEQIVQSLYNENAKKQHTISQPTPCISSSFNTSLSFFSPNTNQKIVTIHADGKVTLHKDVTTDAASVLFWENTVKFSGLMSKAQEDVLAIRKLLNNFDGDIVEHVRILLSQIEKNKLEQKYNQAMKIIK